MEPSASGAIRSSLPSPEAFSVLMESKLSRQPEMLGELQALGLIVRADALAVHGVGPCQHFFVDQPADNLTVLENERHFTRAHFEHRARPLPAGARIAETWIEEARIVHAEFADQRIERPHFS